MRTLLFAFLIGIVLGRLLSAPVDAQLPARIFGTLSGAPIAIAVDASGNLKVKAN